MVEDAVVADAVATARLGQQVGGVGHAFHATGHQHFVAACQQHVVRKHGSTHAGAAHLAQRDGTSALGQPALERSLACRGLALARHQAVAENHFSHQLGRNTGALDRCFDGGAAQVVRGQRSEVALEGTHRGAGRADDDDGIWAEGGWGGRHGWLLVVVKIQMDARTGVGPAGWRWLNRLSCS